MNTNSGTLHHSETQIVVKEDGCATLWRVLGVPTYYYPTKTAAEVAARAHFPHDDEDKRYGRIFFTRFYKDQD